jgi:hypothetical protein
VVDGAGRRPGPAEPVFVAVSGRER